MMCKVTTMSQEAAVLIGAKPTSNYVLAVVTQFSMGTEKVVIKARGRAISKAVDTAEMVKRIFPGKVKEESITISSEKVGEPGKERMVSTIEIVLVKQE